MSGCSPSPPITSLRLPITGQSISVTYRFQYVTLGHMLNNGPDLPAYRGAVADLLLEIAGYTGPGDLGKAERVLTERIGGAELTAVLSATPEDSDAAAQRLLREVRHYQPNVRSSAKDLAAHIRIHL